MYFIGPKILYEQEHNAEQLLVKNFSVKVRWKSHYGNFRSTENNSILLIHDRTTSIWELIDFRVLCFIFARVACLTQELLYILQTKPLVSLLF